MKKNIVIKFGGTSMKTSESLQKVSSIIKSYEHLRVVVVSAVGGVTNMLVEYCDSSPGKRLAITNEILDIHTSLSHKLELSIESAIKKLLQRLEQYKDRDLTVEYIDHILSLGEDLSSLLIYSLLLKQGVNVSLIDARDYIITDDHFGKAVADINVIKSNAKNLPEGISIMQGFVGSTENGNTTTLGRGGSDYSAALIAEGLEASELFIYTDVPGVYTMDPNIIKSAHLIEELSFQEMAEMANFGAKILYPPTLEPCMRASIPIRILSTFEPQKPGTYITFTKSNIKTPQVRAITMRKEQVLVLIKSLEMVNAYGFLANIFSILAQYKISIDLITTSEISVALTVDGTKLGSHGRNPFQHDSKLMHELEQVAELVIEDNLTLIAVIGAGLNVPGMIQKILSVISDKKVRLVCYGASNSSIGILVNKHDAIQIAQRLHKDLLE